MINKSSLHVNIYIKCVIHYQYYFENEAKYLFPVPRIVGIHTNFYEMVAIASLCNCIYTIYSFHWDSFESFIQNIMKFNLL